MVDVEVSEAEEILEEGEEFVDNIDREDEEVEVLKIRLDDLRHELKKDTGKLGEVTKDVKDLMEGIEEDAIHDEPEMTPEEEREAREEGPRQKEYS